SSSGVGAAVPIDISRKNCRESHERISQPKCLASAMASPVFPLAVGPVTTMRYLEFMSSIGRHSGNKNKRRRGDEVRRTPDRPECFYRCGSDASVLKLRCP